MQTQKYIFEIIGVVNGATPNEEYVVLNAKEQINIKSFALVDRTFTDNGRLSNEFRHIYVFPDITVEKDQRVVLYSGKGGDKKKTTKNKEEFIALFWGSDHCVWNNNGADTATLISFNYVNAVKVTSA